MESVSRQNCSACPSINTRRRVKTKHSYSFWLAVSLLVYMVCYFYLTTAFYYHFNKTARYYFDVCGLSAFMCYPLLKLIFCPRKHLSNNIMTAFYLYLIYSVIIYLFLWSGLEKLVYLGAFTVTILCFKEYPLKRKERTQLYYLYIIAVMLILLQSTTLDKMTEDTVNTNTSALLLMLLFAMSFVRFVFTKKVGSMIIAVISFLLQFYFSSRTGAAGCALFVCLFILFSAWKKTFKRRTVYWAVIIVTAIGFYVAYFYSDILFNMYGGEQIVLFGKNLFTGRQSIWRYTFDSIKENFWFGVGGHLNEAYVLKYGHAVFYNAHNQAMGILAGFGVFYLIVYYILFAGIISFGKDKSSKTVSRLSVVFMIVLIVMDFFETNLFHAWSIMIAFAYGIMNSYEAKPNRLKVVK